MNTFCVKCIDFLTKRNSFQKMSDYIENREMENKSVLIFSN